MMQVFLSILVFLVGVNSEDPPPVSYEGHEVISVKPTAEEELIFISFLQDHKTDLWNDAVRLNHPVVMRLSPDLKEETHTILENRNMKFTVMYEDLQKTIDEEKESQIQSNSSVEETGFDFSMYHNLPEIMSFMTNLTETYPEIAELDSIGKSYEDQSIDIVKIGGKMKEDKPLIILEHGVHAREWISISVAIYIMNQLVTMYGKDDLVTQLVDKFEFIIIPVANPDGYRYSQTVDRYWRKTRSKHSLKLELEAECKGVDINRNFDIEHCSKILMARGNPDPCDRIYCGNEPFSESETRALGTLMVENKDRIAAYFDIHGYGQMWATPFAYQKEKPENYDELQRLGEIGINALAKKYGTEYEFGSVIDFIYQSSGTAIDYAYEKAGIKIVYHLGLRGHQGFHLPMTQILPTCEETFDGIMATVTAIQI